MRIDSLDIAGFGCLAGRRYTFPDAGAVLIVEDNEHGKSTLAAAIVAGLCGMPARRAGGEKIKLKDAYRPWNTGEYGLHMTLSAGNQAVTVARGFARDTFAIRDASTNKDITVGLDPDLALQYLQLPRADFQRVAFISGKEVQRFVSPEGIRARLAAVVEGSDDDAGAEAALSALAGAMYPLDAKSIKPETAAKRLARALDDTAARMRALDSSLDAASIESSRLDELRKRQERLRARAVELDEEHRAARLAEVRALIRADESVAREIAGLTQELSALSQYEAFPAARAQQLLTSAERLNARQADAEQADKASRELEGEREQTKARLDQLRQFATASEQDKIALVASEDTLRTAESEVEDLRARVQAVRSGHSPLGWLALAAGATCAMACFVLVVLRHIGAVPGAVGTGVGVLVAAAGAAVLYRRPGNSAINAKLEQAEAFCRTTRQRAESQLSMLGAAWEGADTHQALQRTQQALGSYLADRARLADIEADLATRTRDAADARTKIKDERSIIDSILGEAGIDCSISLDSALTQFREAEKKHRRWKEISESLLPALSRRRSPDDVLKTLRDEESRLAASGEPCVEQTLPASAIDGERQSVRAELDAAGSQIAALERSVGGAVSTYRGQYSALAEEADVLRSRLARVLRFYTAIKQAAEVLRDVAADTRRKWAAALNRQASTILTHLNPDYDTLLFDDTLDFTIRHASDGRVIQKDEIDSQLSTGARDQIYLAVRIACCRELSRAGEALPIILDDPFIAADDDRFASGMKYVAEELARDNQVIILSCHRSRHDAIAQQAWFKNNVTVLRV